MKSLVTNRGKFDLIGYDMIPDGYLILEQTDDGH